MIDEIRRDFGAAVPPLMVHSAVPDLLEALAGLMHATLVSGRVPRFHKDAVSAAVSRTNQCPPAGGRAAWVEAPLAGLDESDAAAARLCLLVACASYRVDEQEVARFRVHHPGDDTLIDAVAWASFAAARRIGGWLSAASEQPAMT